MFVQQMMQQVHAIGGDIQDFKLLPVFATTSVPEPDKNNFLKN